MSGSIVDPIKNNHKFSRPYSIGEEIFHSISHGIGAGLSIAGLTLLVVLAVMRGDVLQVVSFSIYGASLVLLYLASTLYHSFQQPRVKRVFKIMDHAAVFLLIAGTYTPLLLVGVRGSWGVTLLVIIWGIAALGVGFKILFKERFQKISVLAYVLMGWLGVVAARLIVQSIPAGGLIWIGVGGVIYTLGVIFYMLKKVPYMHAVWHLFVLGGSICHFIAVLLYLAPSV
jgi:hemolysin III